MRVIVLASGGVDSGVLLHRAQTAGELAGVVFCNYGQPAALEEWRALRDLRKHLEITAPLHEVPLTTVYAKDMQAPPGQVGPRVVPIRNLLFIAHAANWAASLPEPPDELWFGAIANDARDYFDCRRTWVQAVNDVIEGHLLVKAPLVQRTKAEVVKMAREAGILDLCWSCYAPQSGKPCGSCDSCRSRSEA